MRPVSLRQVMGANLRAARGERRQEDIAQRVNLYGLKWSRATVAAIETGRRDLLPYEVLVLKRELNLTDPQLLDNHGRDVLLAGRVVMPGRAWAELLHTAQPTTAATMTALFKDAIATTEAERRMAGRLAAELHVEADRVIAWGRELWDGRSLADERDRRLAEQKDAAGSSAQRAGRITRILQDEVRAYAKKRRRGRRP